MARIDPGKGQTLRVLYTGEALPQDKESVFYLNMLEIPPKPDAKDNRNSMQLAIRTRIKFFFRPAGLQGTALDAPAKVTWRLANNGKQEVLEAHNPTPYHVSFAALEVTGGARFDEGDMIAPGATRQFPLKGVVAQDSGRKVHYRAINDYGGPTEGDAPLP
ncbi:Chaperone protein EcpD precursor [compost metagenome]